MAWRIVSRPVYPNLLSCTNSLKYSSANYRFINTLDNVPSSATQENCKYIVRRTPFNGLPVYQLSKNGGNKKLTKIRKVEGDKFALRDELRIELQLGDKECTVNHLTGHVLVKGHRRLDILRFLNARNF